MVRKILIIASLFSAMTIISGCYVESIDDRAPTAPGFAFDDTSSRSPGECAIKGLSKGCLDGYIVVNNLTVAGEEFHNADVFANQFDRLINVERKNSGETLVEGEEFDLQLQNVLDTKSFSNGFEYYISGDALVDGTIRKNYFPVNSIREGSYDIRIEKKIKFGISYKVAGEPVDGEIVEDEVVERTYCASLYADTSFEIERGQRTKLSFNDFKIFVADNECENTTTNSSIQLP